METGKDSKQTAALLLESVSAATSKFEKQYQETGMAYNIFQVAGIDQNEVRICRVLADLLDPKGRHCRGSAYLNLFMDIAVKPFIEKAGKLNISKTTVTTEYSINEDRRIDIVLDDGSLFIPIEVKIHAGEQVNQLADYAAYSRKMNAGIGFVPVLFLTSDGHDSGEASKDDYVSISFEKHIVLWLEQCLNLEVTDKAPIVKEMLKQLLSAIKSFCGYLEDETMEINALITESRDKYQAALLIAKSVNELDFNTKAWDIFKEKIYELVKCKLPETKYVEEGEGDEAWYCFDIPVGKDCKLRIHYDWQSITVESIDPKTQLAADKIRKTMSEKTGVRNEDWGEGYVWASSCIKYPGLEDIDNEDVYKYELYRSYLNNPQSAADYIASMAAELKNIFGGFYV